MLCHNPFFKSTNGISKENHESATPFGCGQCLACRINQGRIIKHRILLEAGIAFDKRFVTLTYNDDFKPPGNLLCRPDLQKYLKRLRRVHEPFKLRYYAVGEYGNYPTYRPHYHLALFSNSYIDDQAIENKWKINKEPIGHVKTGTIENDSAAYIAGYTIKKLFSQFDPYLDILQDEHNGSKQFATMSTNGDLEGFSGGIGLPAIKKLAKTLKENRFFDKKKILQQLKIGGKVYPLGRYLMNKLQEEMGINHVDKMKKFWDFQKELFEKHGQHLDTPGGFIASIYNEKESQRFAQKRRYQIFKQRRQL